MPLFVDRSLPWWPLSNRHSRQHREPASLPLTLLCTSTFLWPVWPIPPQALPVVATLLQPLLLVCAAHYDSLLFSMQQRGEVELLLLPLVLQPVSCVPSILSPLLTLLTKPKQVDVSGTLSSNLTFGLLFLFPASNPTRRRSRGFWGPSVTIRRPWHWCSGFSHSPLAGGGCRSLPCWKGLLLSLLGRIFSCTPPRGSRWAGWLVFALRVTPLPPPWTAVIGPTVSSFWTPLPLTLLVFLSHFCWSPTLRVSALVPSWVLSVDLALVPLSLLSGDGSGCLSFDGLSPEDLLLRPVLSCSSGATGGSEAPSAKGTSKPEGRSSIKSQSSHTAWRSTPTARSWLSPEWQPPSKEPHLLQAKHAWQLQASRASRGVGSPSTH